ncbi:MAG: PepSY-associated TM helix domain-containing protein [Pseudomonadota bacterium]
MIGTFRQSMTWLHTWAGLVFCWILYFMFVTGTLGYFDTEIDRWMMPEREWGEIIPLSESVDIGRARLEQEASGADLWIITPAAGREHPHLRVFWQMPEVDELHEEGEEHDHAEIVRGNERLDQQTGRPLAEARETGGGQLLYRMHYLLHYIDRDIGYRIVGILTMLMLVGLVSGVIAHKKIFKDLFTFRRRKGQRSWLDMHNLMSVCSLPFQFMITYSGLIFVVTMWMPFIALGSYGFDMGAAREAITNFTGEAQLERSGIEAPMVDLNEIVASASDRWGEESIVRLEVRYPGDDNARVTAHLNNGVSIVGDRAVFSGTTGELIKVLPAHVNGGVAFGAVMIGLHEGLFAGPVLRWLYFFSGVLGAGMVATGAIYWSEKRKQKLAGTDHRGYRFVECLNIGTIIGLPVGIGVYFLANRLLPLDMINRGDWEVHCMFLAWLLCFVHAIVRKPQVAWKEQSWLAAGVYLLIPIVNALTTDLSLPATLSSGNWVLAGFDLTALGVGLAFIVTAFYLQAGGPTRKSRATQVDAAVPSTAEYSRG